MGERFSLHQFSEVFQVRDPTGIPYVLIGGQAVNYWAERYLSAEPELCKLLPFTSEDIDFKGTRADVEHIANQLHRPALYPHGMQMTALAGAIPIVIGDLKSNIEVVRSIPGVSVGSVDKLAIQAEWSGKEIRVMDPISLVACKLKLAFMVSQQKRQDVAHLKVLVYCVRGFLREFLLEVERGALPAQGWLGAANKMLKLAKTTHGRHAVGKLGIHWRTVLPLDEIAQSRNTKVVRFRERQLPRWPEA